MSYGRAQVTSHAVSVRPLEYGRVIAVQCRPESGSEFSVAFIELKATIARPHGVYVPSNEFLGVRLPEANYNDLLHVLESYDSKWISFRANDNNLLTRFRLENAVEQADAIIDTAENIASEVTEWGD